MRECACCVRAYVFVVGSGFKTVKCLESTLEADRVVSRVSQRPLPRACHRAPSTAHLRLPPLARHFAPTTARPPPRSCARHRHRAPTTASPPPRARHRSSATARPPPRPPPRGCALTRRPTNSVSVNFRDFRPARARLAGPEERASYTNGIFIPKNKSLPA